MRRVHGLFGCQPEKEKDIQKDALSIWLGNMVDESAISVDKKTAKQQDQKNPCVKHQIGCCIVMSTAGGQSWV